MSVSCGCLDRKCGRPSVCDTRLSRSTRHHAVILMEAEQPLISIEWREDLGCQQLAPGVIEWSSTHGTFVNGERQTPIKLSNCFLIDEALVSIETGLGRLSFSIILSEWTRYLASSIRRTGSETKFTMEDVMIIAGERFGACASDGLLTIECWDINDRQAIPVTGAITMWSKVLEGLREFLVHEATKRLPPGRRLVVDAGYFA